MAYSAGFTPHPKISYAGAAPTGAASEAEYVEIGVTQRCDPEAVRVALDESLPPGLDVVDAVESSGGALADRLQASHWEIELDGVSPEAAQQAIDDFLALVHAPVERLMKNGKRQLDARAPVVSARLVSRAGQSGHPGCAILHLVVRHTTPSVRPDDIVTAMRSAVGLAPASAPMVTRLAQGPLNEVTGNVEDPLHADAADDLGRREPTGDAQPGA